MATNEGLRRAYTVWAIFYDAVVRFLRGSRRRSLALLDLQKGDSLFIVGCGTGADFEFLPADVGSTSCGSPAKRGVRAGRLDPFPAR